MSKSPLLPPLSAAQTLNRRHFLQATALATAAAAARAGAWAAAVTPPPRWPVTCRDNLLKLTGQPDCWAAMKFLQVNGVEVEVTEELACNSLFHPTQKYSLATADGLKRVRDEFQRHGMVISAFCMHNRLDERLDLEIEWAGKLAQAAEQLQVGVIRIDVYPRRLKGDEILPFAVNACRRLCQAAEGTAVRYGIENHGRITNDPAFLEKLFDAVGSPKLGLTLDFMNFYWFGHPLKDLDGIYTKFAGRAFHTHCKNLRYPPDKKDAPRPMGWEYAKHAAALYDGDINYQRVAGILRRAGYRGDLCLENECLNNYPKDQHADVLKREIALLRGVV